MGLAGGWHWGHEARMGVGLGLHEACTGLAQGLALGWHGDSAEWQKGGYEACLGWHRGGTGVTWGLHGACINPSSRMQQSTPAVGCCSLVQNPSFDSRQHGPVKLLTEHYKLCGALLCDALVLT